MKDYNDFFSEIRKGLPTRWFLMEGEEEFTKEKGMDALLDLFRKNDFPDMNITFLRDPDAGQVIAACETLPFMAEKRLVVVRDCSMLMQGKSKDFDEDASVERMKEYFPSFPEYAVLVFYVRGKAEGRKKLYTVLKKENAVYSFERLNEVQLNRWLMRRFGSCGKQISEDICKALCFRSGTDLTQLNNEVEKLINYTAEKNTITMEDIEMICTETTEYKVFDLADALLSGQGKRAFGILEQLVRVNTDRVLLISLLGKQCRQLLYATQFPDKYKAASALGVPPFIADKLKQQAAGFTSEQLRSMPDMCLQAELQVKSGVIPENGALENLMIHFLYMRGKRS